MVKRPGLISIYLHGLASLHALIPGVHKEYSHAVTLARPWQVAKAAIDVRAQTLAALAQAA